METQCTPTFDTSCSTVLQTAYKQVSWIIWWIGWWQWIHVRNVKLFETWSAELSTLTSTANICRRWEDDNISRSLQSLDQSFQKICTDVPTQKCVPVPVKVEAEKCVNIPTQTCQNVPVVANVPVPQKQCYRKPRWAWWLILTQRHVPCSISGRFVKLWCPPNQRLSLRGFPRLSVPMINHLQKNLDLLPRLMTKKIIFSPGNNRIFS